MPVNLSIKNAPDDLVARLKDRARHNHRSLQGEMMAILEAAADGPVEPVDHTGLADAPRRFRDAWQGATTMSAKEMLENVTAADAMGAGAMDAIRRFRETGALPDPKGTLAVEAISERAAGLGLTRVDEAVNMVREDRDR